MSEVFTSTIEAFAEAEWRLILQTAGLGRAAGTLTLSGARTLVTGATRTTSALLRAFSETVERNAAELEDARSQLTAGDRPATRTCSHALAQELSLARSLLSTIEAGREFAVLRAAADAESGGRLATMEQRLSSLVSRIQGGRPGASKALGQLAAARRDLERSIGAGASRLLKAEGQALVSAVQSALTDMGYSVRRPKQSATTSTVIKGTNTRGAAVYVEVDPVRGHLRADLAGCSGTSCQGERARLVRALEARGVRVRLTGTELHGRAEGGALVQKVAPLFGADEAPEQDRRRRALALDQVIRERRGR